MNRTTPATAAAAQAAVRHSIFIYTEEQRGNQLVESTVIGMLSDISGSDKLIVVQDPFSGLKFIYRVDHESSIWTPPPSPNRTARPSTANSRWRSTP